MKDIPTINAQELFNKYDEVINITMVNIYTLTKEHKKIILSGIDRKNYDHLFILRVALLAKDIYGFPLELSINFWDSVVLNWKMRKLSRRIPRAKEESANVDVNKLIEFMYPPIREYLGKDFKLENIYRQFYKGELG